MLGQGNYSSWFNVSDASGSNGGLYSFYIRGLDSNGSAAANLSQFGVFANTNLFNGSTLFNANVVFSQAVPQNIVSIIGGINVDQNDQNDGTNQFPTYASTLGISFGDSSGEGIGSKRSGSVNRYGIDFFTGFNKRLSITSSGNVGIGTTSPGASLEVNGGVKLTANSGALMTFQDGTV